MLENTEVQALLQIIGRSEFKGEEVMGVAGLIQKLQAMLAIEEKPRLKAQKTGK